VTDYLRLLLDEDSSGLETLDERWREGMRQVFHELPRSP
jgi:hypothetical protein